MSDCATAAPAHQAQDLFASMFGGGGGGFGGFGGGDPFGGGFGHGHRGFRFD